MTLSTHVLDAALGRPAAGVRVRLDRLDPPEPPGTPGQPAPAGLAGGTWVTVADGVTDGDGRLAGWLPDGVPGPGAHRLTFDTGGYFAGHGITAFYPEVSVTFLVGDAAAHYHLPLLLSPFAYTAYRGS